MLEKTQLSDLKVQNIKKTIIALALSVIVLLLAVYCLLRFGFGVDIMDRSGFHTRKGVTRYLDYYGRYQTGWKYIDEKLYYFVPEDGAMVTGWQTVDGAQHYFGTDGVRATGWQTVDGKTYYLGETGKMVAGWQTIDGKSYYFTEDGAMATGWRTRDGKRSYFSQEGEALTGWQMVEGKLYYFTADGYTVSGWMEMDNVRYCFAEDGAVVTGWYEDETGRFFFAEDGHPHTGWLDWEGERYYLNEDGAMATGWLELDQERYYLQPDGTMAVGEVKLGEKSHFFASSGKYVMLTNLHHPVPEDYVVRLASIEGFQFDSRGRDSLQQMIDACREAGFDCRINNTYRSKATQQRMWDRSVKQYMAEGMTRQEAEAETGKSTALPGHSEHQTGLAVDITGDQPMYDWLAENCWDYGFILRYPEGRAEVTGIMYEPWHFRYVGTELSLELKELGLCLEDYMASLTVNNQQQEEPPV